MQLSNLLAVLAVLVISGSASGKEGPHGRLQDVLFEAQYSSAANFALSNRFPAKLSSFCDFFGYAIKCTRRPLTSADWAYVRSQAERNARTAAAFIKANKDYKPEDLLSLTNGVQEQGRTFDDNVPIIAAIPYPAYIPYAAYNGEINPIYRGINKSSSFPNASSPGNADYDGPDQDIYDAVYELWLNTIYIKKTFHNNSIPHVDNTQKIIEKIIHLPFDNFGHDLFGDFTEEAGVIDGKGVVKFWSDYADFSEKTDLSLCGNGCSIAERLDYKEKGIRAIAACSVMSVEGVVGEPEDCYTTVISDGNNTYVRSSVYINAIDGLDGIGGDELSCKSKDKADTPQSVADRISSALNTLSTKGQGVSYKITRKPSGSGVSLIMATRFGVSRFFTEKTTYEISTIRFDVQPDTPDAGTVGVNVSITASWSNTNSVSQADYYVVSDEQSASMRAALQGLMPSSLDCKVERGE